MPTDIVYSSTTRPPRDYVCVSCGKGGVRLWRTHVHFAVDIQLFCAACAAYRERISTVIATQAEIGMIGGLLPAIPANTQGGRIYTYWDHMSIPQPAGQWWAGLPL